jgi:hypothetical protein
MTDALALMDMSAAGEEATPFSTLKGTLDDALLQGLEQMGFQ